MADQLRPEDIVARLSGNEWREFIREAAYCLDDASKLFCEDVDLTCVLSDLIVRGGLPPIDASSVITIISLVLAVQKRVREGRVTPSPLPGTVEEAPVTPVPNAFYEAFKNDTEEE